MRTEQGYSLWNLMITIGVVGIILTIAMPSLVDMTSEQRVRKVASDLRTSISVARSESVKRTATLAMVPNGTWSNGWCVELDTNATTCTPKALHRMESGRDFTVTSTQNPISFTDWGRTSSCPMFSITSNSCSVCLAVTTDGRVMANSGPCPSQCLTSNDQNAWTESCE